MKSAMTSSPLRVAIIGAGQVADKVHASYYCTRNDLELVAVCDSRLSQAQALAEKYGNASVWDDPQAMLLAVKPDVVTFPLFWQGCELQVTLDAQRIAIRTSAPVSLRLNGQLIYVAEESVFCLGDFIMPFNGTATTHQEGE